MKKGMRCCLCCLLMMVLCFNIVGCASSETDKEETKAPESKQESTPSSESAIDEQTEAGGAAKKYIIGVCEPLANDEAVVRRDYFENYIGPAYNVEFIFSETINDTEGELSFIENIVQAGADAYISFRSEDTAQLVQVCEEYGLYYCVNSNRNKDVEQAYTGKYNYFLGSFGADQPKTGELFKNWLNETASDTGEEGFMIASGLAFSGNIQHYECTVAVLQALQEKYALSFEDTVENLAVTSAPLEIANDKGIPIYIYPGSIKNETWLQGISAGLQTGKYGVFIQAVPSYSQTAVVVDEVEKTFNKNIKVASMASISESLSNAFHTKDSFGNQSLDMATVKAVSIPSCVGFITVYNALTGYKDLSIAENGEPVELLFTIWGITTVEELDTLSTWDVVGSDVWAADTEVINQCLGAYNPDVTTGEIQSIIYNLNYEQVENRLK